MKIGIRIRAEVEWVRKLWHPKNDYATLAISLDRFSAEGHLEGHEEITLAATEYNDKTAYVLEKLADLLNSSADLVNAINELGGPKLFKGLEEHND